MNIEEIIAINCYGDVDILKRDCELSRNYKKAGKEITEYYLGLAPAKKKSSLIKSKENCNYFIFGRCVKDSYGKLTPRQMQIECKNLCKNYIPILE